MKKYLINTGMFYQPKNKLHKAIQEFITQQHWEVIKKTDLKNYKKHLETVVDELNKRHSNCTPVKCNFWKSDVDEHLQLENVVSLSMMEFED